VVEVVYGSERYAPEPPGSAGGAAPGAAGSPTEPETAGHPPGWEAYPGHYRAHNPWQTNFRVLLRGGTLLLVWPEGGEIPLVPTSEAADGSRPAEAAGELRLGTEPTPERIRFDQIADGKALRATLSACEYYRFFVP
jgi:hypothetical protein